MDYLTIFNTEDERIEFYMEHAPEKFRNQGFVDLLKEKGFFRVPYVAIGSDIVADSLFEHNWNVAVTFRQICETCGRKLENEDSWFAIGMFYNFYLLDCMDDLPGGSRMVNLKYFLRADVLGLITIANLSQFFDLTEEEKECFKWHRGMFDYNPDGREFLRAIHAYPAVYALHCAEVICSHIIDWENTAENSIMIGFR